MSKKTDLDILSYNNYLQFLSDFVDAKKQNSPMWSYSQWARDLNLKSTSSISKVLSNKRAPGRSITKNLIKYFEFNEEQAYYFTDLIELEKTKNNPSLQKAFIDRLQQKKKHPSCTELQINQFQLISHWHYFVIRELTRLKDFNKSSYWIYKKLKYKVSIKQINQALRTLLGFNLVKLKGKHLEYNNIAINTKNDYSHLAIKSYHNQVLDLAKQSIFNDDVALREFQANCFSFKKEDLPQAKQMIREFIQKFSSINSKNSGDEVYQLALQFFPATETSRSKELK